MMPYPTEARWQDAVQDLLAVRRPQQAEQVLRRHLVWHPREVFAHILLALALYKQSRLPEARAAAHAALALDPAASEAFYLLSLLENQLGQPTASRAALTEALRLQPRNPKYLAVQAQFLLHQKQWAQAQAAAERGLAHNPVHADCLVVWVEALCQQKLWAALEEALYRLRAAHPNLAATHLLLGQEALRQRQYAETQAHIQEALRLDPLDSGAEQLLVVAKNSQYELLPELRAAYREAKRELAEAPDPAGKAPVINPLPWWGWLAFLGLILLTGGPPLQASAQSVPYFAGYCGLVGAVGTLVAGGYYHKGFLRPWQLAALLLGTAGLAFLAWYSLAGWHKTYAVELLRLVLLPAFLCMHGIWSGTLQRKAPE
ncbi:tetratricopeptide repeat protein [Hymenobacter sp. BT635]|uniref:Tetratricopeptide repeat protein n=1 Tax=Hymenobacter nitidus TaxID=2880929 RepID=A0ABS8AGS4_9BACT|nr:tetratricopeptide repeat protein [Hymenobacter nitidus]MCB2379633.1 tetratricopeptide repeat protein [Hymenobacter nitidus]